MRNAIRPAMLPHATVFFFNTLTGTNGSDDFDSIA